MIIKCWSENREKRLDIRSVYNQLSVASIQEVAEGDRGNHHACQIAIHIEEAIPFSEVPTKQPTLGVVENPLPRPHPRQNMAGDHRSILMEGNFGCQFEPKPRSSAQFLSKLLRTGPLRLPKFSHTTKNHEQTGQIWGQYTFANGASHVDVKSDSQDALHVPRHWTQPRRTSQG
jgi:hypothetical protein